MDETTCGCVEVEGLDAYAQRAEELEAYAQRAEELEAYAQRSEEREAYAQRAEELEAYTQRAEEPEAYAQRAEEFPPALFAFEEDAQSALEEAQIKLTRAGINMNNNRAYVRALEGEIADGQSDLVDARAEQVSYDAEYQAMFSRVQSLTAAKI